MNPKRHAHSRMWLINATILEGISLVVWRFFAYPITIMALGGLFTLGPGRGAPPGMDALLVWATVGYPAVVVVGLVGGWVQHARQRYRAAFWLSLLPLGDVILVVGGIVLVSYS